MTFCTAFTEYFEVEGSKKEQLPAEISVSLGRKPSNFKFPFSFSCWSSIKNKSQEIRSSFCGTT